MESEKVIQQLKDIEHELRGILQANSGIDPKVLACYRDLLHKARLERLSMQVESISASGINPANVLVNMKKDGHVEVKPISTETLKKNVDELQKGLAQNIRDRPELYEVRKKDWRKREKEKK